MYVFEWITEDEEQEFLGCLFVNTHSPGSLHQVSKRTLREALKSELSGDFLDACMAIVDNAVDSTDYVVTRLYNSMKV